MFSFEVSKVRSESSEEQLRGAAPSIYAGQAMAGVSEHYTFLLTARIVASMREAGWVPVFAEEQRVRVEGRMGFQKHMVRFQRRGQAIVKGEYAVEVALVNSHDRSSAYQLHAGLYRIACGNGLLAADSHLPTYRHLAFGLCTATAQTASSHSERFREPADGPPTSRPECFRGERLGRSTWARTWLFSKVPNPSPVGNPNGGGL